MTKFIVAAKIVNGKALMTYSYVEGNTDQEALDRYVKQRGGQVPDSVLICSGAASVHRGPFDPQTNPITVPFLS